MILPVYPSLHKSLFPLLFSLSIFLATTTAQAEDAAQTEQASTQESKASTSEAAGKAETKSESKAPAEAKAPEEAIQKARLEANRNRFSEAKLVLKQSLAANQQSVPLYMELYATCVKAKDWSDAAQSLERVMELDASKEKDVYADYGQALFQLRRYEKARTVLNKALGYGKDKDLIHKSLVKIALAEKDDPEATAEYREYLKLKPGDGDMHWEFANYLYKLGKIKDSLPEYKAASDNRPHDSYGHERYAYLLLCEKDYSGSVAAYKKAIAANPNDGRLREALKYALQRQKAEAGPKK